MDRPRVVAAISSFNGPPLGGPSIYRQRQGAPIRQRQIIECNAGASANEVAPNRYRCAVGACSSGSARWSTAPCHRPAKYDKPYEGELEVRLFSNIESLETACPHPESVKVVACAAASVDHKRCVVHALTEDAAKRYGANLAFSLRHELAHCNGWHHPVATKQFHEGDVWDEAEGAKWMRAATKVAMPKFPASTRILPAYPPVVCVTPDWKSESCENRKKDIWSTARPFQMNDVPKKVER